MFLFLAFAAIVWAGLYIHRRTWWAVVWWLSAIAVLVTVGMLHNWLDAYYHGTIYLPIMRAVLYPYAVLVVVFGFILGCMPKHYEGRPCHKCKYDVTGLAEDGRFSCPECNAFHAFEFVEDQPCQICGSKLSGILRTPDIQCWRCNALYIVNGEERGIIAPRPASHISQ